MKIKIIIEDRKYEFESVKDSIIFLKMVEPELPKATFYHIGGYECLRDGTQKDAAVKGIDELKSFLNDEGIEYDGMINDFYELVESIKIQWENMWDDGGGSGWIECK